MSLYDAILNLDVEIDGYIDLEFSAPIIDVEDDED